jgi:biotin synthase
MNPTTTPAPPFTVEEVEALLERPLLDLVFEAAGIHRRHHDPHLVQCSELLNIKTGGCSEDCAYCSQSAHHDTPLEREPLQSVDEVLTAARRAREGGADRFCMGAAWRGVRTGEEFERVLEMVRGVKALEMEACVTLGMLDDEQASRLQEAGLDFYNHNLDTGASHYAAVVTTHTLEDRLRTIATARRAGLRVCAGGILGMGEDRYARAELLQELAGLDPPPESVPINALVRIPGTPLEDVDPMEWTEMVRVVAVARILMPASMVRLSAGRTEMSEPEQALCFLAGANSIFVGNELLTTPNPSPGSDAALLAKLGLHSGNKRA